MHSRLELPKVDLISITEYKLKQDMDLKKDRWMHMPVYTGLAIYAYDYADKLNKRRIK